MKTPPSFGPGYRTVLTVLVLAGVCLGPRVGRSQGEESPEVLELRAALEMTRARLAESEQKRQQLIESLAESVRVSEEKAFAAQQMQEKMEAFGVDLFRSSEDSLEQRLLKAVRDLDIARQESERQRRSLHDLSEAFLRYLAATPDAAALERDAAELAISKASQSLSDLVENEAPARRLENSRVVSVNPEIGLVVLDAGRKGGVRVGTPVTVNRDENPIFTALVVDVRESVSGALLQERVGEVGQARVGDRVRPLVSRTQF